jgi:aminoglycoside N3'-acetyltransferase
MKVFIYSDSDYDVEEDNVFLSGAYKDVGDFRRKNPGMRPILSYDAKEYAKLITKQMKPKKSKLSPFAKAVIKTSRK